MKSRSDWLAVTIGNELAVVEQRKQRRKERRQVLRRRLDRWIPPLYRGAHIRQLSVNLRQRLLATPKEQGILLWGSAGVGKTHAAMALIRWHITRGEAVQRYTHAELILRLRSCFDAEKNEHETIASLTNVPVLVIDDLSAAQMTDYSSMALLHIIDRRIELCKRTIITSNLSPENIEQIFGERMGSRLKTFLTIRLGGKDKRG